MTLFNSNSNPQAQGAVGMVTAGLLFAVANTLVQYLTMRLGAAASAVAFWQYFIAALLFVPWLWRHRSHLSRGLTGTQFLRVGLGAVGVQFWISGLAHVPIWQAIALIMTSPIFVTLGARIFLGEHVGLRRWAAVIIGAIGGSVILSPWAEDFDRAAFLPVIAALFWAGSSLYTKRLSETQTAESLTAYLLILLVPINAVLAIRGGFGVAGSLDWGLLAVAGIVTAAAQYLLAFAYRRADAAFLQPFDHLKLIFNVLFGLLVFNFVPPGSLWVGAALIVGSLLLLDRPAPRRAARP